MRSPTPNVDLRPDHWDIVRRVLQRHVPHREVLAFGSRATWTAKEYSDLDLAIMGEEPLPLNTGAALAEDLCESDLPFKVDIVDWARTDDSFRAIIRRYGVAVYAPAPSQASGETPRSLPTLRATAERREARDGARTPKRPEHRLGDIADLNWGDTKTTKKSYTSVGFPAYSATGQDGLLPYHDFDRTGVVISAIGAKCGRTWLAKGKWSCIKNTIRFWSTSPDADTEYLYWLTRDPDFWPKRGSAQAFISQGDARAIRIALPGIDEQRAIAHILGTFDDKIVLNRRMNETLEAMARALFKDWFVDFGPTRAKMKGREPYLAPELWDLFPDALDDENKPVGWNKKAVGELCEVAIGGLWGRDQRESAEFEEYYCLRGVDLQHLRELGEAQNVPSRFAKSSLIGKRCVSTNDILIASSGAGPCGRTLWVGTKGFFNCSKTGRQTIYSNFVKRLHCVSPRIACFFDRHLHEMRATGEIQKYISGTSVPNLNDKALLQAHQIILPTEPLLDAFYEFALIVQRRLFSRENATLAQTRDLLLPKLMSGKIRIPDAEKALESVT